MWPKSQKTCTCPGHSGGTSVTNSLFIQESCMFHVNVCMLSMHILCLLLLPLKQHLRVVSYQDAKSFLTISFKANGVCHCMDVLYSISYTPLEVYIVCFSFCVLFQSLMQRITLCIISYWANIRIRQSYTGRITKEGNWRFCTFVGCCHMSLHWSCASSIPTSSECRTVGEIL